MNQTPRGLRVHIGIFGRTNTGKSSFLNLVTGQSTAIVSPVAGTTTDVVEKSMELLPLGPVTFLDTAGIDDSSEIGSLRIEKTRKALESSDVSVLVAEAGIWTEYEETLAARCAEQKTPLIVAINKTDVAAPSEQWLGELSSRFPGAGFLEISCVQAAHKPELRERAISAFKALLLERIPESALELPAILGDLLPSGKGLPLVVLVVPIDLQAPKGRLILPQVQAIRDALDSDAAVVVVKDREYPALLDKLGAEPDLVVCDSQAVLKTAADTPDRIPLTTFSILFSRFKGDIVSMAAGAAAIETLKAGDRVLIAEACTHHSLEDDIGRVKIPRWLRQYTGLDLAIDHCTGKDYPENLGEYRLIIHCGSCTLTRRQMLSRIERAGPRAITNYGMAISVLQGVAERALEPFPQALDAYRKARKTVSAPKESFR
ncbi:MAG: [FeFe] hydrogenase H-cluster maturation GTPase HydF [Spirochaetales bacterium]|nr:[FeFe] hydrogenase H-cluster maturation GTPase HydF [Spirochaetales bacterium]